MPLFGQGSNRVYASIREEAKKSEPTIVDKQTNPMPTIPLAIAMRQDICCAVWSMVRSFEGNDPGGSRYT